MGNGEDGQVERGILEASSLVRRDVNAKLLEETENGARLRRARRVVVAGDEYDRRLG